MVALVRAKFVVRAASTPAGRPAQCSSSSSSTQQGLRQRSTTRRATDVGARRHLSRHASHNVRQPVPTHRGWAGEGGRVCHVCKSPQRVRRTWLVSRRQEAVQVDVLLPQPVAQLQRLSGERMIGKVRE